MAYSDLAMFRLCVIMVLDARVASLVDDFQDWFESSQKRIGMPVSIPGLLTSTSGLFLFFFSWFQDWSFGIHLIGHLLWLDRSLLHCLGCFVVGLLIDSGSYLQGLNHVFMAAGLWLWVFSGWWVFRF